MAETTVTLTGHDSKVVGSGKTVHEFAGADGRRYSTFNGEVAQKAIPLVGQPATLTFKEVQKGQYTNYYLDDVKAANGTAPSHAAPPLNVPAPSPVAPLATDARQQSIQRQASVKMAFAYAGVTGLSPTDAFGLADTILAWVEGKA